MNIWRNRFTDTVNEVFFHDFQRNAETLTVTVSRAETGKDAARIIAQHIKDQEVEQVVSTPLDLLKDSDVTIIGKSAASSNVDFTLRMDRAKIEQADMGISEFEMGISQLGSIFQDASDLHRRLVSMLPPVHLAILPTTALVKTFADALDMIEKVYDGQVPPYLSFITGPSKTADIERELTIGVHGPGKLIIVCVDNCDNEKKSQ